MSSSFESAVFSKHSKSLQSIIEQDVDAVADALVAGGVIDGEVDLGTGSYKVTGLLSHITRSIEKDPYKFQILLKVLRNLMLPNSGLLINKIEADYGMIHHNYDFNLN